MSRIAFPTYRSGFFTPKRGGNGKFPDMWRGCVGAWAPCLGQTYDRIIDQSGNQNHGGIVGTYNATNDWSRHDGQDVFRTYNTGPSYISIPFANASAFTNAGSLIMWISRRGTTTGNDGAWVISSNGVNNHYPYSGTIYDGTFCTSRQTVGSSIVDITSADIPLHSIAITFGSGVYSFFQNGRRIYTASGLTFDPPESTLRIGHNSSDYKSLALHELRLYNICLTPAQVRRFTLRPGQAYEIDYRRRSRSVVASAPIVVTPSTATIVTTAFAPSVRTPRLVTPPTAALSLTSFAPTVSAPRSVTPPAATLVLTDFSPTVSAPRVVTPATAALSLTTFAPAVTTPRLVTPPDASLSLVAFAPAVSAPSLVTPGTATLSLTAFAPVVSAPRAVTPPSASLVLTGFAPTVALKVTVPRCDLMTLTYQPVICRIYTPQTAAISLATFAPTVTISGAVTPPTASLSIATFAPTVANPRLVTPSVASLFLNGLAPAVSTPRTATPATAALSLEQFAPTIYSGKTATPPTATLALATFAPAVLTPRIVTPPTASLTLTRFAPAVSSGNPQFRQRLFLQGGLFKSQLFLNG